MLPVEPVFSQKSDSMKEPTTPEEVLVAHKLLRADPQAYLEIVNGWLRDDPSGSHAYHSRHFAWTKLGQPLRAIEDLDKAIELRPDPTTFRSRAEVFRELGEYRKALDDLNRGEAMDPQEWQSVGYGLLSQADCHARLGDEAAALAC